MRSQGDLLPMQMLNRDVCVWPKAAATGKHVTVTPQIHARFCPGAEQLFERTSRGEPLETRVSFLL